MSVRACEKQRLFVWQRFAPDRLGRGEILCGHPAGSEVGTMLRWARGKGLRLRCFGEHRGWADV